MTARGHGRARREVAAEYAAWAGAQGLAEDGHDAAYRGTLAGVRVRIETGVRQSGLYDVVIRIFVACGTEDLVIKRGLEVASDHRVVAASRALLDECVHVRSVRLDRDTVEVRCAAGSSGEELEEAVTRIADAWRSPGASTAPFR